MELSRRSFDISRYQPSEFHAFESVDHFLNEPIRNGISEIMVGAVPFHLMFKNKGAPTTLVHFAAAMPRTGWDTYPIFPGRPTAAGLFANHLSLSDPNYSLEGKPSTGWFSGSEHQALQSILAEIIRHATKAGVEDQAILFGSSAGGFAALYYGAKIPASVTICANPRVDLRAKPTQFYRCGPMAFPDTKPEDLDARIDTSAASPYRGGKGNTVAYIQNVQDPTYFDGSLIPFLSAVGASEKVWLNLVDSGPGHRLPEGSVVKDLLKALLDAAPDWNTAVHGLGYYRGPDLAYALEIRARMLADINGAID